ncbi:unnamed protein product [Closterium sp. NIES-64]|nr:unnamed protein product [Closterium sp. NIES-64]
MGVGEGEESGEGQAEVGGDGRGEEGMTREGRHEGGDGDAHMHGVEAGGRSGGESWGGEVESVGEEGESEVSEEALAAGWGAEAMAERGAHGWQREGCRWEAGRWEGRGKDKGGGGKRGREGEGGRMEGKKRRRKEARAKAWRAVVSTGVRRCGGGVATEGSCAWQGGKRGAGRDCGGVAKGDKRCTSLTAWRCGGGAATGGSCAGRGAERWVHDGQRRCATQASRWHGHVWHGHVVA